MKPVNLLRQQLPIFLLFRDRRRVAQQCWIRLHYSSNIVGATHAHIHMISKVVWDVSFPRYTAGPNLAGSCCIRLHTTANTHAATHNIAGPTMLGVVRPFARRFTLLRRLGTSKLLAGLSQSEEKAASCHG